MQLWFLFAGIMSDKCFYRMISFSSSSAQIEIGLNRMVVLNVCILWNGRIFGDAIDTIPKSGEKKSLIPFFLIGCGSGSRGCRTSHIIRSKYSFDIRKD